MAGVPCARALPGAPRVAQIAKAAIEVVPIVESWCVFMSRGRRKGPRYIMLQRVAITVGTTSPHLLTVAWHLKLPDFRLEDQPTMSPASTKGTEVAALPVLLPPIDRQVHLFGHRVAPCCIGSLRGCLVRVGNLNAPGACALTR